MASKLASRVARARSSVWSNLDRLIAWGVVAACSVFVFVQLKPSLLLRNTTPAGGDMGAHVWFPAFLAEHLLPHLRLAGWSGDYYGGFPAGQFYFPLPALLVELLDFALPYNIAFKLVTVLGAVLIPIGAALLLKALRAPNPLPALAAVGATVFLFFKGSPNPEDAATVAFNQRIMGGSLASTLAGEFSFALALALALLFLAALAWSLDRRVAFWVPALLGASVVMSHLVVALFAVVGALAVWATRRPVRTAGPFVAIGATAGALTAIWSVPLLAALGYTADMRYEPLTAYSTYLFPGYLGWTLPLVVAAIVFGVAERRRSTMVVVAVTIAAGVAFRLWEGLSSTPVWNLRLLPFWYLGVFLLAAIGAAELARGAGWLVGRGVAEWRVSGAHDAVSDAAVSDSDRAARLGARITISTVAVLVAAGAFVQLHQTRGFLDFWARWNFTGIEETGPDGTVGKAYPEYRALLAAMAGLPPGRALWEPSADIDRYGTTLALMMLPYHTDGRISSMEGLYYESSASTPYVFLTVAKLTAAGEASNPVRGLEYRTIADFDLGVRQLQLLGVRYYLAQSDEAKEAAAADPRLTLVARVPDLDGRPPAGWDRAARGGAPLVEPLAGAAPNRITDVATDERSLRFRVETPGVPVVVHVEHSSDWRTFGADGPEPHSPSGMVVVPTQEEVTLTFTAPPRGWEIYEVDDRALVSPLEFQPVVVDDLRSRPAQECYEARGASTARTEGLGSWECVAAPWWDDRAALDVPLAASGPPEWQRARDVADVRQEALPPVEVTEVRSERDRLSFRVDRTDVPVLVKVSDYPNWEATGADGPWRVTPNLMVVVPTEEEVTLEFVTTGPEWAGRFLTVLGVVGLVALAWWGRRAGTMTRPGFEPKAGS